MSALTAKRIVLGITGGIAAYKSADLVRRLKEHGAQVRVVMTRGAQAFITPLTLQAVSGEPVRTDLLDPQAEAAMSHIELARWADFVLVAPASANFISRLAQGSADDLLATLCLATEAPIAVAPAMNRVMWRNPATQENVRLLSERGVVLWGPGEGDQACGETGEGRMLEPLDLVGRMSEQLSDETMAGKSVLITAGPTLEPIDPVRYLTNHSSGRMGYAVAQACAAAGARVTLVSGPVSLEVPAGVERVEVQSAQQMYDAVMSRIAVHNIFIGSAAVADYRPVQLSAQKIKKQDGDLSLALERTQDILAGVSRDYPDVFTVGFAAETQNLQEHARDKLQKKGLNMIAANRVDGGRGFGNQDNALWVAWTGGEQQLQPAPKLVLARQLVALINRIYDQEHNTNTGTHG